MLVPVPNPNPPGSRTRQIDLDVASTLGFQGISRGHLRASLSLFLPAPPPNRTRGVAIAGFHILAHPKLDASENFLNISVTLEGRLT